LLLLFAQARLKLVLEVAGAERKVVVLGEQVALEEAD
jgi:hypothetical protein